MIKELTITTTPTGAIQIAIAKQGSTKLTPMQAILYLTDAMIQISGEASKQIPQTTIIKQF